MPAIALTAYAHPQDRDKALGASFNEHMTKPFEPDMFLRKVASMTLRK